MPSSVHRATLCFYNTEALYREMASRLWPCSLSLHLKERVTGVDGRGTTKEFLLGDLQSASLATIF